MQFRDSQIIVIFLLLFISISGFSQIKISGIVIDKNTGDPLIGANVIDKMDATAGNVTDFDGSFQIDVDHLPVVINISYIGYASLDYEVQSKDQKIKIEMEEDAVTIDLGVEIKGQRVSEKQKAAPLTIESLDAIAIKQTASTDFYNGLGSLKGVDLTTASLGFTVINTRGFNSTSPVRSLQTIDGVDNQSPGLNFSLGNFLG
ncbi:MAG: carboxypeptidase-like regulatory domain-containing protein, partial [Saprospiraceae bacterium]|nr:carboxypeptidase-like regulatory domain-containing protein [Saprospiraceae bacterium]